MLKEDKVIFLKNPNEVLEHLIKNFIKTSELNRRTQLDYGMYFDEPLVGFASGNDPLFLEYKNIIGSFHYTPGEIIEAALREKSKGLFLAETDRVSVISWILPAQEDVRKSNRGETQLPSQLWLYLKEFGEACNDALRQHVVHYLEDLGYTAVAPARLPSVKTFPGRQGGLGLRLVRTSCRLCVRSRDVRSQRRPHHPERKGCAYRKCRDQPEADAE